jgi:hypothetical protein
VDGRGVADGEAFGAREWIELRRATRIDTGVAVRWPGTWKRSGS